MIKFINTVTEIIGWITIALSPTLAGLFIGVCIYAAKPNDTTLTIGIIVAALGLITGIIWACRVWKNYGTNDFLSRVSASPELDSIRQVVSPKPDKENQTDNPNNKPAN